MRFQCLVCLLLAGLAYGQTAPSATPPAAAGAKAEQSTPAAPAPEVKAPEVEVKVGPDDTVITLKGFCSDATLTGDACKTAITRAQFEKLADSLQPNMPPNIRRQLAAAYPRLLKMSAAAEKRGLDKQPSFEAKMNWARMQVLSQELTHALQEDSDKVADGDIQDYYKKNEANYEQATFARIFVPWEKQIVNPVAKPKPGASGTKTSTKSSPPPPPTEAQKKAAEEAMTKLAADLRARAVKGEDPDKLQKEANAAAGLKEETVTTKLENERRSSLPASHQAVMDLKPGEVSEVISDAKSGHYIYIMIGKGTMPIEKATAEIRKTISSQRYRDSTSGFQKDIDLNDAYFEIKRNPAMPPPATGAKPPAEHADNPK